MQDRTKSQRRPSTDIVGDLLRVSDNVGLKKTAIMFQVSEWRTCTSGIARSDTEELDA